METLCMLTMKTIVILYSRSFWEKALTYAVTGWERMEARAPGLLTGDIENTAWAQKNHFPIHIVLYKSLHINHVNDQSIKNDFG